MRILCVGLLVAFLTAGQERWDAKIQLNRNMTVPFSFQFLVAKDGTATASWGDVKSTAGKVENGKLRLEFGKIGTHIEADFDGKSFTGQYFVGELPYYKIEAAPYCTCGFQGEAGPDVSGDWILETGAKLTLKRQADDTLGDLQLYPELRFNQLIGRFDGLSFALAEFDGQRGVLVDAEPGPDGKTMKITVTQHGPRPKTFAARKQ